MPPNWMNVSHLSFNAVLLLEQVQLSWLPGWLPERELSIALKANPAVEWFMRHKCPQINDWLNGVMSVLQDEQPSASQETRQAEITVLASMTDLLVYAIDPAIYDAQPFLNWDPNELTSMTNFEGRTVIDVGAGTGHLSLIVAPIARCVFAVDPVANLRNYLKKKAGEAGLRNVFPVDGLITDVPFPNQFADVTMGGHVFGEQTEREYKELLRVTRAGGMIILCPGNNDKDDVNHKFLTNHGFKWSRFEEPEDGWKRKYWRTVE